jgi:AcrR family transcriptional regulator
VAPLGTAATRPTRATVEQLLKPVAQQPSTRERLVTAGFETLRAEGFARTSARSIARRAGVNQALVFYHFGGVTELLLAALDASGERRRERYEEALRSARTPTQLVEAMAKLHKEDQASGHSRVLTELFAASLAAPALGPELIRRMEPWVDFTAGLIHDLLKETPFGSLIEPRVAARTVLSLYLGLDLLDHLRPKGADARRYFREAGRLAAAFEPMFHSEEARP